MSREPMSKKRSIGSGSVTWLSASGGPAFASNTTIRSAWILGSVSDARYRYSQERMRSARDLIPESISKLSQQVHPSSMKEFL